MKKFLLNQKGMNIIGQGSNIIRSAMPFLIAAILCNIFFPRIAALPGNPDFLIPTGYVLLIVGIFFWLIALVQLIGGFRKGEMITGGAFSVCRNPIYASYIVFILPAVSFITLTWVYLAVAVIMYVALRIFIEKEENDMLSTFGDEYRNYMNRVPRVLPLFRKYPQHRQALHEKIQ